MRPRVLSCSGSLDGGGSERQLSMLASHLDPQLFESEVYLLRRRGPYLSHLPERVPVHAFWDSAALEQRFEQSLFNWPGRAHRAFVDHLSRLLVQRRIAVVYDRSFHMALVTSAACRIAGTPRVSVIVSPPSRDFSPRTERFHWLKRRLLARGYRHPSCTVVTVSEAVADDASRYFGIERDRILTIPSPVDDRRIRDLAAAPTDAVALGSAEDFKVVVVGRLSPEKGQKLALQAAARLLEKRPQLPLKMLFIGEGPHRAELEQMTDELKLRQHVLWLGFQENPYPLIDQAELLCLPSLYEGLPNVVMEAMSLGTPVVATDCGIGLRELLGEQERGFLVPPSNPEALATALLDRIDNPAPWQHRAQFARSYLCEHHDLAAWIRRMQEVFTSRIGDQPQSSP